MRRLFLCVAVACLGSVASAETYTFGFFYNPPLFEKTSHGYVGHLVNLVKMIFAQDPLKGTHLSFKSLPLKRLQANLKEGSVDMSSLSKVEKRELYGVFTTPFLHLALCAYTREGNPHLKDYLDGKKRLTLDMLKSMPLRITSQHGNGWFEKHIARHKGQLKISYIHKRTTQILWVLNGRGDIFLSAEGGARAALARLPQTEKRKHLVPLPITFEGGGLPIPLIISKRSPLAQKLDQVNEAIALTLQSQKKEGQQKKSCTQPL